MRNKIITWLMRALVGVTFIISGFVKAIDPWGPFYKIQDYIVVFGWNITSNIVITGVFALCTYEFCVGIFTLLGCYRKSVPFGALLLMLFMLPLTLWIALTDPVADCGCFGDAFIISNWATFWKNILLTLAIIWLIKFNKSCICLIRPYIQWLALISSVLFIVVIGLVGYIYQPLIDFRPFPIGSIIHNPTNSTIENEDKGKEGSDSDFDSDAEENDPDEMIFIYSKDGEEHQFTLNDELPDEADGWKFVRRENVVNKDNTPFLSDKSNVDKSLEDSTIQVWSEDGDEE
ncbi:MAG: DoxX family membrane protein, partial [Muribaculaceae bacterium]|nr:DoxX family membrane protein [Muribaculaceae bacterium]